MLTLTQLRDRQKSEGLSGAPEVILSTGDVKDKSAEGSSATVPTPAAHIDSKAGPQSLLVDDPSADLSAGKGYLKIFPPQFASINQVTKDFQEQHWRGPSPWCRVEGMTDHPEFENNLKLIENQQ